MPWPIAIVVGSFQAVALVPGISRSGSTISGGLLSGMERESAATFSFLIAIPAIAGAALLDSVKWLKHGQQETLAIPVTDVVDGNGGLIRGGYRGRSGY